MSESESEPESEQTQLPTPSEPQPTARDRISEFLEKTRAFLSYLQKEREPAWAAFKQWLVSSFIPWLKDVGAAFKKWWVSRLLPWLRDAGTKGWFIYFWTLLLELPGVVMRFSLLQFVAFPLLLLIGLTASEAMIARVALVLYLLILFLSLFPILASLATLIFPGGSFFTRFALGARDTSRREKDMIAAAMEPVQAQAPKGTIAPTGVFVIDAVSMEAYVVGTTLYLTREMIRSPFLGAVIAHELGHINSADGRLTLALRRLVVPPVYVFSSLVGQVAPGIFKAGLLSDTPGGYITAFVAVMLFITLSLAGGGFGLWLLGLFWTWYFRGREYVADHFAAKCGMAANLAEFLERNYQFMDTSVPYFLSTHPYTELRIDKLLGYAEGEEIKP
jgi:Zn-dependent protease with chaperone function